VVGAGVLVGARTAALPPVNCGWYRLAWAIYWAKGVVLFVVVLGSLVSMGESLFSIWLPCWRAAVYGLSYGEDERLRRDIGLVSMAWTMWSGCRCRCSFGWSLWRSSYDSPKSMISAMVGGVVYLMP
jgi:hypothetical protein